MGMTVYDLGGGNVSVGQDLISPVVYLDHWAVRMFSEDAELRSRFLNALHGHGGTLLFSQVNFSEFAAMTDFGQAEAVEQLLDAALPNLYVADMTADPGFTFPGGSKDGENEPLWLLREVAELCARNGGKLTTKSLVTDVIKHRDELQPIFDDMKAGIAAAVKSLGTEEMVKKAKDFKPHMQMTPHDALSGELLRTFVLDASEKFSTNDAADFVHAAPALVVADFVLLDVKWTDKVSRSADRLKEAGVTYPIARCYSKRGVDDFLRALEGYDGAAGKPAG